jgi:hypothetical protein
MINTKDLEYIIALTLATAYIEGETPQSTMLVSDRPEAGKTTLVNKFRRVDGIAVISDGTAKGILESFKTDLESGKLKHLIIPEFLAPISRNQNTVNSFIATIQILIEDGFQRIDTGFMHQNYKTPRRIGVIACLPKPAFMANRVKWTASGLMSRFLVVSYNYSFEAIDKILESIMLRQYAVENDIDLRFNDKVSIELPYEVALLCKDLSMRSTEKARNSRGMYGFRQLESVQRMVMANVILEKAQGIDRPYIVDKHDFEKVDAVSYLFNEEFNEVKQ